MTPGERLELAFRLGDEDLESFRATHGLDRSDRHPTSGAPATGHPAAECVSRPAHRMSLVDRVVASSRSRPEARYAVIGAAAMAVHGVGPIDPRHRPADAVHRVDGRAGRRCRMPESNVSVVRGDGERPARRGDPTSMQAGERPVDLVVGRYRWQQRLSWNAPSPRSRRRHDGSSDGSGARPDPAQALRRRLTGRLGHRAVAGGSGSRRHSCSDVTTDLRDLPARVRGRSGGAYPQPAYIAFGCPFTAAGGPAVQGAVQPGRAATAVATPRSITWRLRWRA